MFVVGNAQLAIGTTDRKEAHDFIRLLTGPFIVWFKGSEVRAESAADGHKAIEELYA